MKRETSTKFTNGQQISMIRTGRKEEENRSKFGFKALEKMPCVGDLSTQKNQHISTEATGTF